MKLFFEPPPKTGNLELDRWSNKLWNQLNRLEEALSESGKIYLQSQFTTQSTAGAPVKTDSSGKVAQTQIDSAYIDHNQLIHTHNLTSDINHNTITNTHNLTTNINHNTIANTHNLTTDIDFDNITNSDLTGPIGSNGHVTSITSQTGTGTKIVVDTSPVLVTPNIGAASGSKFDCSGDIRSTGRLNVPSSGAGIEIVYDTDTNVAWILSYNRTTSAYKSLTIQAGTLYINSDSGGDLNIQKSTGKIGFFGVPAVVQQTSADWTVLANVVTALKNLGLLV